MAGFQPAGQEVHEGVKDYYGKRVKKSDDLMTSCCTVDRNAYSTEAKDAMKLIHPEVLSKYNLLAPLLLNSDPGALVFAYLRLLFFRCSLDWIVGVACGSKRFSTMYTIA